MTCEHSFEGGAYCGKHSHGAVTLSCTGEESCPDRIPITNADRLRSFTDEEMAEYIDEHCAEAMWCNVPPEDNCPEHNTCVLCILDWLRKEWKDDA
jgi:hypothetical protein